MEHVFAYGTLQFPDLMRRLLGRLPTSRPALLHGYARYAVRNEDFPGLVPEAGSLTDGLLFENLNANELARLDKYESEMYDRLRLKVHLAVGETCEANVYVVSPQYRHLLSDSPWDLKSCPPPPNIN
ncbi:MAG: gamma-glutamylcyclotransferase [Verrucomicrobia bacterium]|nr:gamma-glutamylcyclotransferase [Verrucomicrobiota bacterium]MCH8510679.1 gamma-glutamylcyclotransferase [Kiritimatiellia bacterium]